jgi:hypothetical protein
MTKATILELTRRQLMEETPQNWTDVILDDIINAAYHIAQKEIMKIDPEAFLEWIRRDLISGESYYARPEGSWWPNQVRVKDPSSGKYTRLTFKPFDIAEEWSDTPSYDPNGFVWARRGIYVCIFPTPAATVTAGLELIHVPTLTLTVDSDVPKIPLGLHLGIVYISKIIALGETYQNFDRDVAMVQRIMGDLSSYYSSTGGENLKWRPDLVKPLGYGG